MPYFLIYLLPVRSFSLMLPLWAGLCATFTPLSGTHSLCWPSGLTNPPLILSCNNLLTSFCCWGEWKHAWRSALSLEVTASTDNAVQVDGGMSAHHCCWPRSARLCAQPRERGGDIPELPSCGCIFPPRPAGDTVPNEGSRGGFCRSSPRFSLLPASAAAASPRGPGSMPGCRVLSCRTIIPRGTSGPAPAPRRQLCSDLLLLLFPRGEPAEAYYAPAVAFPLCSAVPLPQEGQEGMLYCITHHPVPLWHCSTGGWRQGRVSLTGMCCWLGSPLPHRNVGIPSWQLQVGAFRISVLALACPAYPWVMAQAGEMNGLEKSSSWLVERETWEKTRGSVDLKVTKFYCSSPSVTSAEQKGRRLLACLQLGQVLMQRFISDYYTARIASAYRKKWYDSRLMKLMCDWFGLLPGVSGRLKHTGLWNCNFILWRILVKNQALFC